LLLLLLLQVTADSPTNADSVWDIINLSADAHPIHLAVALTAPALHLLRVGSPFEGILCFNSSPSQQWLSWKGGSVVLGCWDYPLC
jgi:hypothetical protein